MTITDMQERARQGQILELARRLQEKEHERALESHPMFSSAHWAHHAAASHPEMPDDDSYLFFENCIHPDCVAVRVASHPPPTPEEK